jgi:hypothetical protein
VWGRIPVLERHLVYSDLPDFFPAFVVADDEVVLVVVGEVAISDSACVVAVDAVVAAVVLSTFRYFCIASPRLRIGCFVSRPASVVPVIAALRSANEMPRFFDTLAAAMSCPKFLNPAVALLRSVPGGSTPWTLLRSVGFVESFSATGLLGFQVLVVVVVLVELVSVVLVDELPAPLVALDDVDVVDVFLPVTLALARAVVVEPPLRVFTGLAEALLPDEVFVVVVGFGGRAVCPFALAVVLGPALAGFEPAGLAPSRTIGAAATATMATSEEVKRRDMAIPSTANLSNGCARREPRY